MENKGYNVSKTPRPLRFSLN